MLSITPIRNNCALHLCGTLSLWSAGWEEGSQPGGGVGGLLVLGDRPWFHCLLHENGPCPRGRPLQQSCVGRPGRSDGAAAASPETPEGGVVHLIRVRIGGRSAHPGSDELQNIQPPAQPARLFERRIPWFRFREPIPARLEERELRRRPGRPRRRKPREVSGPRSVLSHSPVLFISPLCKTVSKCLFSSYVTYSSSCIFLSIRSAILYYCGIILRLKNFVVL